MKRAVILLIILTAASTAFATRQEKDLLILEGRRIYTYDLPGLAETFPSIKFPEFVGMSTANYKGYRATWATFQNQLYLVGLEAQVPGKTDLLRNEEIVPGHAFPLKVTAWSGKITQVTRYTEMSSGSMVVWEVTETTTITVSKGVVVTIDTNVDRRPRNNTGEQSPASDRPAAAPEE